MLLRDKITNEYLGIKCDIDVCEAMAPPAKEIMEGHGLNNMGWKCFGGSHICPVHAAQIK